MRGRTSNLLETLVAQHDHVLSRGTCDRRVEDENDNATAAHELKISLPGAPGIVNYRGLSQRGHLGYRGHRRVLRVFQPHGEPDQHGDRTTSSSCSAGRPRAGRGLRPRMYRPCDALSVIALTMYRPAMHRPTTLPTRGDDDAHPELQRSRTRTDASALRRSRVHDALSRGLSCTCTAVREAHPRGRVDPTADTTASRVAPATLAARAGQEGGL